MSVKVLHEHKDSEPLRESNGYYQVFHMAYNTLPYGLADDVSNQA